MTTGDWMVKGDRLFETLADSDPPVVIFFDEVPILVNRLLKGSEYKITPERIESVDTFMSWLRENSIRHKGKVRMVISGSIGIEPVLRQAGLSSTLNVLSPYELKAWDEETTVDCLIALANNYDLTYGDGACEKVVELLGECIPHHVQMFFDGIYSECHTKNITKVETDLVEDVYDNRMLGVRGHAELSHLEERLRMVLGTEEYKLALELLTETAVVGELSVESAKYLSGQYEFDDRKPVEVLREILEIFEHDGYLKKADGTYKFISKLLRDWWKARFEFLYIPVSERGQ